jgi:hypothetical protein
METFSCKYSTPPPLKKDHLNCPVEQHVLCYGDNLQYRKTTISEVREMFSACFTKSAHNFQPIPRVPEIFPFY